MAELNELLAALTDSELETYLKIKGQDRTAVQTEINWTQDRLNRLINQRATIGSEISTAEIERIRRRQAEWKKEGGL